MKYKIILRFLRLLVYVKRFVWWVGGALYFILKTLFSPVWRAVAFVYYKLSYLLKKGGLNKSSYWLLGRKVLQVISLAFFLLIVVPQTKLYSRKDIIIPGQKTIAYALSQTEQDFSLEEVYAEELAESAEVSPWREAVVIDENYYSGSGPSYIDQELGGIMAGGMALNKPTILPGASVSSRRDKVIEYTIEQGDSLSSIAFHYGVSVATIMWENNLTLRSLLKPGTVLRIPPSTGLMHTVKRGDTLNKIANAYEAKVEDIIKFNKLKDDGSDLVAGEKIMIPNGIRPEQRAVASIPRSNTVARTPVSVPPSSRSTPSVSGFVWPSAARMITQYYNWKHHAIDLAGPMNTANYAAKAGTVEKAQCGWNSGYGCYIIINHGGGVKTLYGHHNKLLVSPGDYVEAGQTIGLMGNTGKVYGRTGIHLHFEIQINGVRVNPLGYVK